MSRCSKVERVVKQEVQTCARDESCQSNVLHEISNLSLAVSTVPVCSGSVTLMVFAPRRISARSSLVNFELGESENVKDKLIEELYLDVLQ